MQTQAPDLRDIFPRSGRARDYDNYRADLCPYHDDTRPSLLVYSDGFHCRGCGVSGTVWDFINKKQPIVRTNDVVIEKKPDTNYIDDEIVERMHSNMNDEGRIYLAGRGITEHMILSWRLGMNTAGTEILIPVYEGGKCVNLKRRIMNVQQGGDKYKSWEQEVNGKRISYGSNRLFNADKLEGHGSCIIVEGEFDCILTNEHFQRVCITPTTGSGSWNNDWNERFENFSSIYIIPDRDIAGLRGAMRIADRLGARRCYIVPLPGRLGPKGDMSDFWRYNGTRIELITLISRATPAYAVNKKSGIVKEYESL